MSEIDPQQSQHQQALEGCTTGTSSRSNNQFICGVVEGFYGKPWTFTQRKDLFRFLRQLNLNAFMYAPKDDVKHRAEWRHLYNDTEANELRTLINEAESNGIDFYYSLAPGLDMTYSSQEDLKILRQKYDQLRSLGCKSFAILFDDIEPRIINGGDIAVFGDNYAQAQVSVTNMIFDYLNQPKFLFCPTEYCESRAVPSVPESQYLNSIGSGLHPDIDFMWSGSRVISRYITEESIQKLTQVIRRPPVIWENLHANDYDKKRVYLGPYSGRSTKIIPKLRGVLTNPNCEYEANYIAIHTLAQWSRCTEDVNPHNRCDQDTQMATAMANSSDPSNHMHASSAQQQNLDSVYDPDRALVRAIRDWLPHVLSAKSLPSGDESLTREMRNDTVAEIQITKEVGCEVQQDDCPAILLAAEQQLTTDEQMNDVEVVTVGGQQQPPDPLADDDDDNSRASSGGNNMDTSNSPGPPKTTSVAVMTANVSSAGAQIIDTNSCDSCEMREASPPENSSSHPDSNIMSDTKAIVDCIVCSANNLASEPGQVGGLQTSGHKYNNSNSSSNSSSSSSNNNNNLPVQKVDLDSLALVVDFFYLPFEHGLRGHALLSDIKWLVDHSDIFLIHTQDDDDVEEGAASAIQNSSGPTREDDQETRMNDDGDEADNLAPPGHGDNKAQMKQFSQSEHSMSGAKKRCPVDSKLVELWVERAERLGNLCTCINRIFSSMIHDCPNKLITAELYPYLAELRDVLDMIMDYIKFLRNRRSYLDRFYFSSGPKRRGETVALCDEQEPWVRRGGLIGDMQRLIS